MSDVMLFGVLRMPYDMAMNDELSRQQFYDRVQQAADALELKDAQIESLKRRGKSVAPYVERIEALEAALTKIVDKTPANKHKKWPHHHWYLFTAREALETTGDSK